MHGQASPSDQQIALTKACNELLDLLAQAEPDRLQVAILSGDRIRVAEAVEVTAQELEQRLWAVVEAAQLKGT